MAELDLFIFIFTVSIDSCSLSINFRHFDGRELAETLTKVSGVKCKYKRAACFLWPFIENRQRKLHDSRDIRLYISLIQEESTPRF